MTYHNSGPQEIKMAGTIAAWNVFSLWLPCSHDTSINMLTEVLREISSFHLQIIEALVEIIELIFLIFQISFFNYLGFEAKQNSCPALNFDNSLKSFVWYFCTFQNFGKKPFQWIFQINFWENLNKSPPPPQWRCELTPYSQRAHLNISHL